MTSYIIATFLLTLLKPTISAEIGPGGEMIWNITSEVITILGDEVQVDVQAGTACLAKEMSQLDIFIEGCDHTVRESLPFDRVACVVETDWWLRVNNPSNCTVVVQPTFLWDKRSSETVRPPREVTIGTPFRTLFNNTGHYLDSTPYLERNDSTATCYEKPLSTNNVHTAEFEWFCTESGVFSFCYIGDDIVDYCHRVTVLPIACNPGYECTGNCSTLLPKCTPTCGLTNCEIGYKNNGLLCNNGNCTHDSCCTAIFVEPPPVTYQEPQTFFMVIVLILVFGCCTLVFGGLGIRYWLLSKKKKEEEALCSSIGSMYRSKSGLMRAPLLIEEMNPVMVQSTGELDLSTSSTPTMLSRHLSASVGVYGAANDSPMSEMLTTNSIKTPIGIVKKVSIYEPGTGSSPPSALKRIPINQGTFPTRSRSDPMYSTTSPIATPR
eukprot:TRINITY_DN503_c0_g4_i3.p1 TRINITY_DN503_c0_g4~~TRINITY_DN503_c0_g4_i3.p1  ORF type:complete len:437 (+),score=48.18 TRINITY_DN503_c0_g4_i3:184-1494(+)